jgi:hypothetical protein
MASATPTAMYSQNSSQSGTTVAGAFPQTTGQGVGGLNLDLLQIVQEGGNVILNVDSNGTVHNPAVSPTNGTRIGQFLTTLTGSPSTANLFANAFANLSQLDILQVVNEGGNVHYWLDFLGVAHGS